MNIIEDNVQWKRTIKQSITKMQNVAIACLPFNHNVRSIKSTSISSLCERLLFATWKLLTLLCVNTFFHICYVCRRLVCVTYNISIYFVAIHQFHLSSSIAIEHMSL